MLMCGLCKQRQLNLTSLCCSRRSRESHTPDPPKRTPPSTPHIHRSLVAALVPAPGLNATQTREARREVGSRMLEGSEWDMW